MIVPVRNETNAARTGLSSQLASCALMPNCTGSATPAAKANRRYGHTTVRPGSRRYARSPATDRGGSMLSFGVTVLPDPPYQRMIELMTLAERHGFEYAWTYDSHILWEESYATLPLAAARASKIKLGAFVTNPGIRDPTITASWYATMQDISDGRMVMGIGRGDSSGRVVGLKPVREAEIRSPGAMI